MKPSDIFVACGLVLIFIYASQPYPKHTPTTWPVSAQMQAESEAPQVQGERVQVFQFGDDHSWKDQHDPNNAVNKWLEEKNVRITRVLQTSVSGGGSWVHTHLTIFYVPNK